MLPKPAKVFTVATLRFGYNQFLARLAIMLDTFTPAYFSSRQTGINRISQFKKRARFLANNRDPVHVKFLHAARRGFLESNRVRFLIAFVGIALASRVFRLLLRSELQPRFHRVRELVQLL